MGMLLRIAIASFPDPAMAMLARIIEILHIGADKLCITL